MKNRPSVVVASLVAAALAVALASRAEAQGTQPDPAPARTVEVGIAAGAAFPLGGGLRGPQRPMLQSPASGVDVAGGANVGFTIAGSVGIVPAGSPVSYRVEMQYTRFGLDPQGRFGPGGAPETADGQLSSLSGIGNVVLAAPAAGRLRPYLIGGAGVYRITSDIVQEPNSTFGPRGSTRFGLNGGAGLELAAGPVRTFVEARYHGTFSEGGRVRFVPVTIGMKWR